MLSVMSNSRRTNSSKRSKSIRISWRSSRRITSTRGANAPNADRSRKSSWMTQLSQKPDKTSNLWAQMTSIRTTPTDLANKAAKSSRTSHMLTPNTTISDQASRERKEKEAKEVKLAQTTIGQPQTSITSPSNGKDGKTSTRMSSTPTSTTTVLAKAATAKRTPKFSVRTSSETSWTTTMILRITSMRTRSSTRKRRPTLTGRRSKRSATTGSMTPMMSKTRILRNQSALQQRKRPHILQRRVYLPWRKWIRTSTRRSKRATTTRSSLSKACALLTRTMFLQPSLRAKQPMIRKHASMKRPPAIQDCITSSLTSLRAQSPTSQMFPTRSKQVSNSSSTRSTEKTRKPQPLALGSVHLRRSKRTSWWSNR